MIPDADWVDHTIRPLAASDFQKIRDLAYRSFGLDLKPGKEGLVSARLQKLVRSGGFRSYQAYYRHVLHDTTGESLMALIDALATNHTAFLRESEHFDFLRREVAPALARRPQVDVWSAACSTGEEVWTLAFLLNDALPSSRIHLLGTDVSRKSLACAERAAYAAERVACLPRAWVKSYLHPDGSPPHSYRVKRGIRAQVVFERLNLVESLPWLKQFPIVFCRNVMIYFDRPTQQRVIANLTASLEPGGYLFVGHAESFTAIEHRLEYVHPAVYRKPAGRKASRWNG